MHSKLIIIHKRRKYLHTVIKKTRHYFLIHISNTTKYHRNVHIYIKIHTYTYIKLNTQKYNTENINCEGFQLLLYSAAMTEVVNRTR